LKDDVLAIVGCGGGDHCALQEVPADEASRVGEAWVASVAEELKESHAAKSSKKAAAPDLLPMLPMLPLGVNPMLADDVRSWLDEMQTPHLVGVVLEWCEQKGVSCVEDVVERLEEFIRDARVDESVLEIQAELALERVRTRKAKAVVAAMGVEGSSWISLGDFKSGLIPDDGTPVSVGAIASQATPFGALRNRSREPQERSGQSIGHGHDRAREDCEERFRSSSVAMLAGALNVTNAKRLACASIGITCGFFALVEFAWLLGPEPPEYA